MTVPAHRGAALPTMAHAVLSMAGLPEKDFTFFDRAGRRQRWAYPELGAHAQALGAALLRSGLPAGARLGLAAVEPFDTVRALFACFAAGIVPALCAPPNPLGDARAYAEGLAARLRSIGASGILADPEIGALLASHGPPELPPRIFPSGWEEADPGLLRGLPEPDPRSLALLQFTSGSGSEGKAVRLTHANLAANSKAIYVDGLAHRPDDRVLTWLPLYHDMGLIGQVVATLREGLSATLYPTISFLKRPSMWMEAVSSQGATIACAPNFAFDLAARCRPAKGLDLKRLRVLGCGAEPILAGTLRAFLAAHRDHGLDPGCLVPCYGLAESTLAATFAGLGEGLRTERIRAADYRERSLAVPVPAETRLPSSPGGLAGKEGDRPEWEVLETVSCGAAFPGHGVSIRDPGTGAVLPEGRVGEIVLTGPSVADGYDGRPEDTRATFPPNEDGGAPMLRTGDLGYLREGRLFVTGRIKDLIIVNGRNYDPHEVERIAEAVPGVRAGSAFAFSVPGPATECLAIVLETRGEPDAGLSKAVASEVSARLGVVPKSIVAVPPHVLPKTTSGKKRRPFAREAFLRGDYAATAKPGSARPR